jgi:hypothetical protein
VLAWDFPADADERPADTPAEDTRTVRLASPLRGLVRFVVIVVACEVALYLAWRVRGVIRLVAISLFFALTLLPIVDASCGKTRAPRGMVILATYVLLVAAIALVGFVVAPSLVKEIQQLSHNAPRYATELRHNATFRHYDDRYHISTKLVDDTAPGAAAPRARGRAAEGRDRAGRWLHRPADHRAGDLLSARTAWT